MENGELHERWQVFAHLVASGVSATEAYLRAGNRCSSRASAQAASSRLRHHPKIQAFIAELCEARTHLARERRILHIRQELAALEKIILTGAGSITESHELSLFRQTLPNGTVVTRLPCKLAALRRHSELCGDLDPWLMWQRAQSASRPRKNPRAKVSTHQTITVREVLTWLVSRHVPTSPHPPSHGGQSAATTPPNRASAHPAQRVGLACPEAAEVPASADAGSPPAAASPSRIPARRRKKNPPDNPSSLPRRHRFPEEKPSLHLRPNARLPPGTAKGRDSPRISGLRHRERKNQSRFDARIATN